MSGSGGEVVVKPFVEEDYRCGGESCASPKSACALSRYLQQR